MWAGVAVMVGRIVQEGVEATVADKVGIRDRVAERDDDGLDETEGAAESEAEDRTVGVWLRDGVLKGRGLAVRVWEGVAVCESDGDDGVVVC